MNRKMYLSGTLLLICAIIWGTSFIAQSVGMEYIGPYTFNAIRFIFGGLATLPVGILFGLRDPDAPNARCEAHGTRKQRSRSLWIGGVLCGIALCIASNLQQYGILYSTVGKAGFITALYIIIVPILGLFLKKKCSRFLWIAVGIALVGLYLLCIKEEFVLASGDIYLLLCSFMFSVHTLLIDKYSPVTNGIQLSSLQFFVAGIGSALIMFFKETIDLQAVLRAAPALAYSAFMACGVAYTLQVVGQKHVPAAQASLILSLESCIAALSGWIILGQKLSPKEILGCVLMFAAILLAQIPAGKRGTKKQNA